jgi:hypothetical protein
VGFSGWDQVLTGSGGGGINYVSQGGTRTLPFGYTGTTYDAQINATGFDSPVVRFLEPDVVVPTTPEPASLCLAGAALLGLAWRKHRRSGVA